MCRAIVLLSSCIATGLAPLEFVVLIFLASLLSGCVATPATYNTPINVEDYKNTPIKVACIGDSITMGAGATKNNSYPAQLGRMLGPKWKVFNFGSGGRTLLNTGDFPYQTKGPFTKALNSKPDVVVIMLGTNDTKPRNWTHKDQFAADLKDMISKLQNLDSHPRIFINTPPYVAGDGNFGINEAGVKEELPIIKNVAKQMGVAVIDVYAATAGKDDLLADRVHPNNLGAQLIARTVYAALTGQEFKDSVIIAPVPITNN